MSQSEIGVTLVSACSYRDSLDRLSHADVLIGGGPLIMEPACGYESYHLFKFVHTVPVYIFYATLCDTVDVSVQSRVPLPGLDKAFAEAVKLLEQGALPSSPTSVATPFVETTPSMRECALGQ